MDLFTNEVALYALGALALVGIISFLMRQYMWLGVALVIGVLVMITPNGTLLIVVAGFVVAIWLFTKALSLGGDHIEVNQYGEGNTSNINTKGE